MKKLYEISDEHIKHIAKEFYDIYPDMIEEIRRSDKFCILFWKRGYETGRLYADDSEMYFSDEDGQCHVGFKVVKFLLYCGYDIFGSDGDTKELKSHAGSK